VGALARGVGDPDVCGLSVVFLSDSSGGFWTSGSTVFEVI
jgi:hypothetical protein